MTSTFNSRIDSFLASPYGRPFRQTVEQRTSILMPNVRIQVDAVSGIPYPLQTRPLLLSPTNVSTALSRLVVASLSEDEFGVVQKHVPAILQCFSSTIDALEKYIANPPIHWTDIEAKKGDRKVLREPDILLKALKTGLRDIAVAFKPYVKDMALSGDVRTRVLDAKEGALL